MDEYLKFEIGSHIKVTKGYHEGKEGIVRDHRNSIVYPYQVDLYEKQYPDKFHQKTMAEDSLRRILPECPDCEAEKLYNSKWQEWRCPFCNG